MDYQLKSILIVDDNRINRKMLEDIFADDFNIIEANDGVEALEILAKRKDEIGVIILDIIMPRSDGLDVLKEMMKDKLVFEIPVIVVTSVDDIEKKNLILDMGATDIISKPFEANIVYRKILNIVKKNEYDQLKIENTLLREQNLAQIQLKAILNNANGGVVLFEATKNPLIIYANVGYEKHVIKREIKDNESLFTGVDKETQEKLSNIIEKSVKNNRSFNYEYLIKTENDYSWLQINGVPLEYEFEKGPVILAIITDISELKATERKLEEANVHLNTLINNVPGGIVILDIDDHYSISFVNDYLLKYASLDKDEFLRRYSNNIINCVYEKDQDRLREETIEAVKEKKILKTILRLNSGIDSFKWCRVIASPIEYGGKMKLHCIVSDFTKEKIQEEELNKNVKELKRRANYDLLTNIYNRSAFAIYTKEMIEKNKDKTYLILRWNIRQFKIINDLYGTVAGNRILIRFAKNLEENLSEIGTYSRYEGDNFVTCFPKDSIDLEKLYAKVVNNIKKDMLEGRLTVHVGVYEVKPNEMITVDQMCDRASLAIKGETNEYGKHFYFYDDSIINQIIFERDIVADMADAIKNKEFVIYYQPIHSLEKNRIISGEALVRWIHPGKGILSPGVFVPIFEKNRLIHKLDMYVLNEVMLYLTERKEKGYPLIPISVNLSRKTVYMENSLSVIKNIVDKYGIDKNYIRFEITESSYIENSDKVIKFISDAQKIGFKILMDDFGSEYSSLNTLKDANVDILKLDMRLAKDIGKSQRAEIISEYVIKMAKALDIAVIAEGVETEEQIEFYKKTSCDRIQGWIFSKPLPKDEFDEYIEEN